MLKRAIAAAAAAIVASVAFTAASDSAPIWVPHGGGGGGGHFAPHGFGGGGGMRFAPHGFGGQGFAASRVFRPGGFAGHYGVGRYAYTRPLGHAYGWGHAATTAAAASRFASVTPLAATGSYRHGWYGQRDYRRGWVGWGGSVFWPYAYDDLFDYAFWPYDDYDDLFWSYGYDDLFAGVLMPYASAPAYAAPAPQSGAAASGGAPAAESTSQLCGSAQSLAGGAASDSIAKAIQLNADQSAKLDALKNAEADAEKTLAASCIAQPPTTAVARLDVVQTRLQAMVQAANAVGGPLADFYASLTDEQKAAFNALGQKTTTASAARATNLAQLCGPDNAVPVIALGPIDSAVQPDSKQQTLLAALGDAAGKADDAILASCPKSAPLTPTGRLDAVKARLQAMLDGVNTVKQPLQDFYASLTDAQKAKFDALTEPPGALQQNASAPAVAPMPSPAPTTPPSNAGMTPTPSPSQSNVSVAPAAPTTPPQPNAIATPTPSPAESNASVTPPPAVPTPGMTPTPEPSATATP